ncbi:MAG: PilZ domain-containing protein [Planctomycetota bacterium]
MSDMRRFSRFSTSFGAEMRVKITHRGQDYVGRLEDLSVMGMGVSIYDPLPVGGEVGIELSMAHNPAGPLVRCHGRIARSQTGWTGLEVTSMSRAAFAQLKSIVTDLSVDPQRIEQELQQFATQHA